MSNTATYPEAGSQQDAGAKANGVAAAKARRRRLLIWLAIAVVIGAVFYGA